MYMQGYPGIKKYTAKHIQQKKEEKKGCTNKHMHGNKVSGSWCSCVPKARRYVHIKIRIKRKRKERCTDKDIQKKEKELKKGI